MTTDSAVISTTIRLIQPKQEMQKSKNSRPAESKSTLKMRIIAIGSIFFVVLIIFIILNTQINQRAIQVYNDTSTPIFVVIDSGIRGTNLVEIPIAESSESKRGILINPQQDGTVRGAATLGDAPTVHVWGYEKGKLGKELYSNPPPWVPFALEGDSVTSKFLNFVNRMFSTLVLHWDGVRVKGNTTKQ